MPKARRNNGLSALNALLSVETYMTENGYFKMDGSTVITGIMRRETKPYGFMIYYNTEFGPKVARVAFDTDGSVTTFEPRDNKVN